MEHQKYSDTSDFIIRKHNAKYQRTSDLFEVLVANVDLDLAEVAILPPTDVVSERLITPDKVL